MWKRWYENASKFTDPVPAVSQMMTVYRKKIISDKHLKLLFMRLQKLTACS